MDEEVAQCSACGGISPIDATGCLSCGAIFGPTSPPEPTFLARITGAWRGHVKVEAAPKPHDPTRVRRIREAASLLRQIKPEDTVKLVRELAHIVRFSPPFGHYTCAFALARALVIDDEFLADQLEHDPRLDDMERELLFALRAELALRDLEACLNRTFEPEVLARGYLEQEGIA